MNIFRMPLCIASESFEWIDLLFDHLFATYL